VTLKGLHFVTKRRPGKPVVHYVYAWRGGPCLIRKEGGKRPTLGAKETQAYVDAVADQTTVKPGTFAALVRDYRRSEEWKRLADNTRRTWTLILDKIEDRWGPTPLSLWSDPRMVTKIRKWRDEAAATPRAADNRVTVLHSLLAWGRLEGRVLVNVAAGIPHLYEGGNRAEIIWTAEDVARFAALAPQHVMDGLRLAAATGLRRADLVALKWSEIGEFAIVRRALKKSKGKRRKATMPIIPELAALLHELRDRPRKPGVETVLVNSYGEPWSGDGYGGSFNRVRDAAGIVHREEGEEPRAKHLHDVRGTYATKLMLAKLTDTEIADIMAWSVDRIAQIRRVYVDQARVIVAIGERIAGRFTSPIVNRSGTGDE
jgi:integrase